MKARDTFQRFGWGSQGRSRRHPLIAGILLLVMIAQFGCAGSGVERRSALELLPPSPGEAVKVAVTSGRFAPAFDLVAGPPKTVLGSAARGVPEGFRIGLNASMQTLGFGVFAIPYMMILVPVLVLAGAGSGVAEHARKVEEREINLREMIESQNIQDDLRYHIVAMSGAKTPHAFTALADQGPSAPGDQPDYRPLTEEGIQAVLEVVIQGITLSGNTTEIDPPLGMRMTVDYRLVRTLDNAEIYTSSLTYTGRKKRTLAEWVSDQKVRRDEINRAYAYVAEKTIEGVLPLN